MCRLLYVRSETEFDISKFLLKFSDIAKDSKEFQGHGWGCSYLSADEWKRYKNIRPVWEDNLNDFGKTKVLLAHARSAFKDEGICIENNMPFFDDKYEFAFNGELRGVRINSPGRIGAEKIFNYIKRFYKGDIYEAIDKAAGIILKMTKYARAMNFVLCDKNSAYVYSFFSEDPEYFTLYVKTGSEIIVSSMPFPGEQDWKKIQNKSLTKF
ncbi:MAG: Gamma-glutamyl-hercynylcysteine sulfoxide hydrolase [Ignavibacteria bacterium]|nr:Gamma-glutamyl-hercynylcysteine sulfoxide hydrolase [Ignavibacteria bacterium]